ncbi:MAG: thioesterase II family protein [Calditrichaceae bacterium]
MNKMQMPFVSRQKSTIVIPKPAKNAKIKLFCLPFAGGSSAVFRSWPKHMPDTVEVCAVEIPGRGQRINEPLRGRIETLVAELSPEIKNSIDRPFAIFGHSLGAIIGFEIAHHLKINYGLKPVHLFLSGTKAPQLQSDKKLIYNLPDAEFLAEIKKLNGTPAEVFEHQDLLKLIIPILRADFKLCETYSYEARIPLDCPISVLGGLQDPHLDKKMLESWSTQTNGPFFLRMFPGDHFYLNDHQQILLSTITRDINAHFNLNLFQRRI